MNILVINSGSSSIKFQLIKMPSEELICNGIVERIGHEDAVLKYKANTINIQKTERLNTHKEGLKKIVELLSDN